MLSSDCYFSDICYSRRSVNKPTSQIFLTATFKNDALLMQDIFNIWLADIQPILNLTGFLPSVTFQPLTKPVIENFVNKNGGNALGFTSGEGPYTSKPDHDHGPHRDHS